MIAFTLYFSKADTDLLLQDGDAFLDLLKCERILKLGYAYEHSN